MPTETPFEIVVGLNCNCPPHPVAVTLASMTVPGVLLAQRNQAAVPAATPVVAGGTAADVHSLDDAEPRTGSSSVKVAKSACEDTAVLAFAGWMAVKILIVPGARSAVDQIDGRVSHRVLRGISQLDSPVRSFQVVTWGARRQAELSKDAGQEQQ
ncbi:hypothetical protein [Streptomyces sp. SYP-A7185]|uniref:hypothetical protein n=1 Tax=Streptomyces sp. SYP-A7185 TaxID=3040076 RepID=UPI0038F69FAE